MNEHLPTPEPEKVTTNAYGELTPDYYLGLAERAQLELEDESISPETRAEAEADKAYYMERAVELGGTPIESTIISDGQAVDTAFRGLLKKLNK